MALHVSDETLREILRREWCRGFDEGLKYGLDEGRRRAIDRRHINRAKRELAAAAMQPANGNGAIHGEDRAAPMTMSND